MRGAVVANRLLQHTEQMYLATKEPKKKKRKVFTQTRLQVRKDTIVKEAEIPLDPQNRGTSTTYIKKPNSVSSHI